MLVFTQNSNIFNISSVYSAIPSISPSTWNAYNRCVQNRIREFSNWKCFYLFETHILKWRLVNDFPCRSVINLATGCNAPCISTWTTFYHIQNFFFHCWTRTSLPLRCSFHTGKHFNSRASLKTVSIWHSSVRKTTSISATVATLINKNNSIYALWLNVAAIMKLFVYNTG